MSIRDLRIPPGPATRQPGFLGLRVPQGPPPAVPPTHGLADLIARVRAARQKSFMARVRIEGHVLGEGCWIWTGPRNSEGYGLEESELAHRAGYQLFRGAIPAGLVLDHRCERKSCVNPWHLDAVTSGENSRRSLNRLSRLLHHFPS